MISLSFTLASAFTIAYTAHLKTCNPIYVEQLPDLIQKAIGVRPSRIIPIPTVPDTIVYQAVLPTTSVIFKAIDPAGRDSDGISLEAWMCERVRTLGVPAPAVLMLDTSCSVLPTSYFIMEQARGQPLTTISPEQQPAFLRQIGAYLRQIHSVQLERFGWLDEDHYRLHGTIQGSAVTWQAAVLQDIPASLAYFEQKGALDEAVLRTIESVLALAGPVLQSVTKGQLLHGDLGGLHVWVDPERECVTSFVDFGERSAGDPIWDIMRFEWESVPGLIDGYELEDSVQGRFWPTFYLYAVLQALPWARKWHERGGLYTLEWLKTAVRRVAPLA